jgi:AAA ATPase domain
MNEKRNASNEIPIDSSNQWIEEKTFNQNLFIQQSATPQLSSEQVPSSQYHSTETQQLSNEGIEIQSEASLTEEIRELKSLDRIYGRDEEQKIILQTYHQTIHQKPANPSALIIQVEEGIGKTFLVEQTLSQRVRVHDHGFFVHWNVSPNDGFDDDAFAILMNQILTLDESIVVELQESFQQGMEEKDQLTLITTIPCLTPLFSPIAHLASNSLHDQASGRLLQILLNFFQILANSLLKPLVFFLDNFQHADVCTHRLLA